MKVASSSVGLGVFATRPYEKDQPILCFSGSLYSWDEIEYGSYVDEHCLMIGPDTYLGPSGGPDDFINHSCSPNAKACINGEGVLLKAVRSIDVGEEITYDYEAAEWGVSDYSMKCKCGNKNCRKTIGKKL
jgi:hypothetical protein